jgi:hypothetical protein
VSCQLQYALYGHFDQSRTNPGKERFWRPFARYSMGPSRGKPRKASEIEPLPTLDYVAILGMVNP